MPISLPILTTLSDEKLFPIVGCVIPAWILLCIAPRWKWTRRTAALSLVVVSLLQVALASSPIKRYGLMGLVERIFTYPGVVELLKEVGGLATWAHLAAADLATAIWLVSDSHAREISHFLMIPQLLLTFAFPPAGMLVYLLALRPLCSRNSASRGLPTRTSRKLALD